MTMTPPPLSTGTMIGLMRTNKFQEFSSMVFGHFDNYSSDYVSALKVSRTVASFAYEKEFAEDAVTDIIDVSYLIVNTIFEHQPPAELTDKLLQELHSNTWYFLSRIVKQRFSDSVSKLGGLPLKISDKVNDRSIIINKTYQIYGEMWNYVSANAQKTSDVNNCQTLLSIAQHALNYLMTLHPSSHFSIDKLMDRTISLTRIFSTTITNYKIQERIQEIFIHVSTSPIFHGEARKRIRLACLVYETALNHSRSNVDKCLENILKIANSVEVLEYFKFLTNISPGKKLENVVELNFNSKTASEMLPMMLPMAVSAVAQVSTSVSASDPGTIVNICASLLPVLRLASPSASACRILERLDNLLFALVKNCSDLKDQVAKTIVDNFSLHLSVVKSLGLEENTKSSWSSLTVYSYNIVVHFYNKKFDVKACDTLLKISIEAGENLVKIDPSQSSSLRTRLKLRADLLFYKQKQYKESLQMLAQSLACLLMSDRETEETVQEKLTEASLFWRTVKRDWMMENVEEANAANMLSLLSDTNTEKWLLMKLLRLETTWYRQQYQAGVDMTQTWVNAAGAVLKNSDQVVDKAMVLLEQSWVFWLGDNTEDLEMGTKCCGKAATLLAGSYLEGLAWFWKFKCEHRLMMLQVQGAIDAAGEEQVVARKEKEGLQGEEEREPEPTPAYPGLELSVQTRLVSLLDTASSIWTRLEFVPSDWMEARTMSQIILATGLQLELLGHSGVVLLKLAADLASKHRAHEEFVVAMTELINIGAIDDVEIDKFLDSAKMLNENKKSSALSCMSGLALGIQMKRQGNIVKAAEILNNLLECENLKPRGLVSDLIKSKIKYELSKLELHSEASQVMVGQALELGISGWQLAQLVTRWWQEDVRTANKQDPSYLWLGPYIHHHQIQCLGHVVSLFRTISAPRELKCYVKLGLKFCQVECLALRTADFLANLALTNLVCEDDTGAGVQIAGAQFVLAHVLNGTKTGKSKAKGTDDSRIVKLPGQDDRSMSPSLMRHNNNPPSFLHHPDTCDCPPCSLPLLHQVILKIMFTQAWSLVLQEDMEQAKSTFALLHETFQLLSNKTESAIKRQNITTDDQLEDLRYIYMGCLLQEAECLAWHQLWDDVSEVNKKYSQVVNDISGSYLDNNPSLLVWHAEQVRSCEMLREKEERRRRKEEEEMMMVTQMSLLQCHDHQEDVVTPECTKTTNSRIGTPKKCVTSSLGVGDPENLAKSLDSILSLISTTEKGSTDAEEEVDVKTPVLKSKRKPRKPRLIEELAVKTARNFPKIQVQEDTPNKFFKSRNPSNVENTSPNFRTPKVPLSLTKDRTRTKSKSSDVFELNEEKSKAPIKNLKSLQNFEIFDDSQLKTPSKTKASEATPSSSSSRRTTGRSSKKVISEETDKDNVFATPAQNSRKPSSRSSTRKEMNQEATQAQTSSRKTSSRSSARKIKSQTLEESTEVKEEPVSTNKRSTRKVKIEVETPSTTTRSSKRSLRML